MSTVVSKMQTVKGIGVGKSAAMGKLRRIWRQEELERAYRTQSEEWAEFSRAVGIAISRIEESVEYLGEAIPPEAAEEFSLMLGLIRSREFLCEIKDMIEGGISVSDAVTHLRMEYKDDTAVAEVSALIVGILQGFAENTPYSEGDIAVIEGKVDISSLVFLARMGVSAFVCFGELSRVFVRLCDTLNVSVLVIPEEELYKCTEAENAILYPDKGALFVSPEIEIVSDFSSKLREDQASEIFASFCNEGIYSTFEYGTRKFSGFIIDAKNIDDEEKLFILYRRVAEAFGGKSVTVCLNEKNEALLWEHLRAVCRAAVYGEISIAARVRGVREYERIKSCLWGVCDELRAEKREFEDSISLGVMIDNIASFLVFDSLARCAERITVDMREITAGVLEEDKRAVCESFLRWVLKAASPDVRCISVLGEACITENILRGMCDERDIWFERIQLSDTQ